MTEEEYADLVARIDEVLTLDDVGMMKHKLRILKTVVENIYTKRDNLP